MSLVTEGSADPYRLLAEVFHDVLSGHGRDTLLDRIADALGELVPQADVHIYEANEAKRELTPVLARSRWIDQITAETLAFGEGIAGWAVEHREAVLANKARVDPRFRVVPGTPAEPEALIAVPLIAYGRLQGAVVLDRVGEDVEFTDDEFLLTRRFADAAALAMDSAHVRESERLGADSASALLAFGREIAEARGIPAVAARVVAGSARILSSPSVAIWLQSSRSGDLVRLASTRNDPPLTEPVGLDVIPAEKLEPWLSRTEAFLVEAVEPAAIASPQPGTDGRFALAPFVVDGRRGVIAVAVPSAAVYADHELELLGGLALQTMLAFQSASSYETLERTFLSTVEVLANALEASDELSSTHMRWITDLALKVGAELELEPDVLKRLELGALFHDIGKIGVPSRILTKTGPLTEEERAIVEKHPILGERMLAPIEQLEDVGRIVRAAHEHYDGSGYPDQASGAAIPLESRIILVCNAFDAMTTDRPYRKALGVEEARRRLVEASGSQFDPQIVDAFLRVLETS
ncbi:MAG: HD domain-containing phosphohydrolase [Gaiellaceae bacterium]